MRIIAGKAKGHHLKAPQGLTTRPTTDKVKESIFNIIQGRLYGSIVIDLFAGSGNLGIEALSREADIVYFVDNNRNSIKIIKENLKKAKLFESAMVMETDVLHAIESLARKAVRADIIFLDPPYQKGFIIPVLEQISLYQLLHKDGIIIVEHDKKDETPDSIQDLEKYRTNTYGDTAVSFYHLKEVL